MAQYNFGKSGMFVNGGLITPNNEAAATGNIFYVHNGTGSDGGKGTLDKPFKTLDYAIGRCTASSTSYGKRDMIYLMPYHAETLTAQINADVAGIKIIGIGDGSARPTLTGNGTIDVIDVSAAGIHIENVVFAVPGTDAQTADINVDAAGCTIVNTLHHGSTTAKNKVDIITLTANAHDCKILGVHIYNDTVECVGGIILEGACKRVEIAYCHIQDSVGWTNGAISDEATTCATAGTNLRVGGF